MKIKHLYNKPSCIHTVLKGFLIFCTVIYPIASFSQFKKAPLDVSDLGSFQSLRVPSKMTSFNGKYFVYFITNNSDRLGKIVIKGIESDYSFEIKATTFDAKFSSNNLSLFFLDGDSLRCLDLLSKKIINQSGVSKFELFSAKGLGEYLVYTDQKNSLVIRSLFNKNSFKYSEVLDYQMSENGKGIYLQQKYSNQSVLFSYIELATGKRQILHQGSKIDNVFEKKGDKSVIFSVIDHEKNLKIWKWNFADSNATLILTKKATDISGLYIRHCKTIINDGRQIFLELICPAIPVKTDPRLEIWKYSDLKLPTEIISENTDKAFLGALYLGNGEIRRIETDNEKVMASSSFSDKFIFTTEAYNIGFLEEHWNKGSSSNYVINLESGRRTKISKFLTNPVYSPNGNYALLVDTNGAFHCYDFSRDTCFKIISPVVNLPREFQYPNIEQITNLNFSGFWTDDDKAFFYYKNDIYLADLKGKNEPLNFTNGYGHKNNISFNFTLNTEVIKNWSNQTYVLAAFDNYTKQMGFYNLIKGEHLDPKKLSMGDYWYEPLSYKNNLIEKVPHNKSHAYILNRSSVNQRPNFYFSRDLKQFKKITDFEPQNKFNWMSSEVKNFKSLDGREIQRYSL